MPVHTSIARGTGDASADVLLTPVLDSVITSAGDQFQMSRRLAIIGAGLRATAVTTTTAAYLDIPSNNELGRPAITPPFLDTAAPTTLDLSMYPTQLQVGDPLAIVAAREAVVYEVAVFFADRLECPGPEPMAWVGYTCGAPGAASIADRWQAAALTITTRLPAGRYRILAIRHYQAEVVAMRLVVAGTTLRPGAFTLPAGDSEAPSIPRPETSGVLATFDAIAPPSLELYQPGAGTPATGLGFLLLQRIDDRAGAGRGGCGCGKGGSCGCGGACGGA